MGKHITKNQHVKIEAWVQAKKSVKFIATALKVNPSTIYRELKRGQYNRLTSQYEYKKTYSYDIAQNKIDYNKTAKGPALKISNDFKLVEYIENKILNEKYSPYAVLQEIKNNNLEFKVTICKTTLYNYIYSELFLKLSRKHLIYKKRKKYKKVQKINIKNPLSTSIENRPDYINDRSDFGHWEQDLVICSAKKVVLI